MAVKKSIEERIEELENLVYLTKNVLSFEEACKFLNLSKSYLYKLTSTGSIPHYKPQGKMIYFEKDMLEAWLRQNPVKTQGQIDHEALQYVLNRKEAYGNTACQQSRWSEHDQGRIQGHLAVHTPESYR